jgi:hypothetical protein
MYWRKHDPWESKTSELTKADIEVAANYLKAMRHRIMLDREGIEKLTAWELRRLGNDWGLVEEWRRDGCP